MYIYIYVYLKTYVYICISIMQRRRVNVSFRSESKHRVIRLAVECGINGSNLPLVNEDHYKGKSPFVTGKSTINSHSQ